MKTKITTLLLSIIALTSCHEVYEHKTVICIPVYGQSLALGEEAIRITDFDSLSNYANGRIVTENMDHSFGYFDNNDLKQTIKKVIHYQKRAFELSVYSMAEILADNTGNDTLICIFPGGQGATTIDHLGKGSEPYQEFIEDIQTAYDNAQSRGWDFIMPALCWMQGETDITDYPGTDYRSLFLKFYEDFNNDVKRITGQKQNIEFICYQTNPVTRAQKFDPLNYDCPETIIPQAMLELVRDSTHFYASGPMYPYNYEREAIHIDGKGQQEYGRLIAKVALDILRKQNIKHGLLPQNVECHNNEVIINFNVPEGPLVIDTIQVWKAEHYGFSVVTKDRRNIAKDIVIKKNSVHILCSETPDGCRIRYAINGEKRKSGRRHGPRGNLRDSIGNWCWQFDMSL